MSPSPFEKQSILFCNFNLNLYMFIVYRILRILSTIQFMSSKVNILHYSKTFFFLFIAVCCSSPEGIVIIKMQFGMECNTHSNRVDSRKFYRTNIKRFLFETRVILKLERDIIFLFSTVHSSYPYNLHAWQFIS